MSILKSLCAYALCALAALSAQARPWEDVKKSGTLVVATEGQYPPFNFFQGSKLTGFEIELTEVLAKKMGVALQWKSLSFDALLAGLRQDRWDLVIASHAITPERQKAVSFGEPHYCSGAVIVAKDAAIKSVKDLAGRSIAVQTGTTYMESAKSIAQVKEVKNFPQDTDARSAVIAGRVDAWITDLFVARGAIAASPASGLHIGDSVYIERIAAAAAKGNTTLVDAWNKALAQALADGTYAAVSQKFANSDIRCK